jgi:hypothetical protein
MKVRYTPTTLVGAAAMLAIGASLVFAQDTSKARPRSQRRIPISKEAPGEVARVDTVTVYHTDTLRITSAPIYRVDTLRMTNTRVDTVALPPRPVAFRMPSGVYFGLAAGQSNPAGAIFTPNSAGFTGQAQLGWQNATQVFGVRGDMNYAALGQDSNFGTEGRLWNFSADAKLALPIAHVFGNRHRFAVYGIGGYTYTRFWDLAMRVDAQPGQVDPVFITGVPDYQHQNGWNAGGGVSLLWGRNELFVESRVLAFTPSNAPMVRQIPIVLGLNWY